MRSSNKRVDDFKAALANGKKRNGNHFITVSEEGPEFPDELLCKDCDRILACLALKQASGDVVLDQTCVRPCLTQGRTARFYYHDTLCLSFNMMNNLVTDHGYWGYSVTTSRSIRWYLEALYYEGYIDSQASVDRLCKLFKTRSYEEADQWVPANG
jgi:hypothetical protein